MTDKNLSYMAGFLLLPRYKSALYLLARRHLNIAGVLLPGERIREVH